MTSAAARTAFSAKAEATRGRIVEAAADLLMRFGLHQASVADICAAAGVSKGSFFHLFQSKDEAVAAAVDHYGEGQKDRFCALLAPRSDDPLEVLYASIDALEAMTPLTTDGTCLLGRMAHESDRVSPEIHVACRRQFGNWKAWQATSIARCIAVYPPRVPIDPAVLAEMMICTFEGAVLMARAEDDPAVITRAMRFLRHQTQFIFGPRPGDAALGCASPG